MSTRVAAVETIILLLLRPVPSAGFTRGPCIAPRPPQSQPTALNLVPISKFRDEMTFLDKDDSFRLCLDHSGRLVGSQDDATYELCLVEEKDLPDVTRFVIDAFGAEAISLAKDLNRLEKALLKPTVGLLNAYADVMAYAEVLSGLQSRLKDRLKHVNVSPPKLMGDTREEKLEEAARSCLVLALARRSKGSDWRIDVIASVELRLQPCDAKIPFSFPWLDRFERNVALMVGVNLGSKARDLQPYLSNLCVADEYRNRSIGKALVRCIEDIATTCWGYKKIFLHVDLDNKAALKLYQGEGYKDAGRRWNPFWAGKSADIGYFVKRFGKRKTNSHEHTSTLQSERSLLG